MSYRIFRTLGLGLSLGVLVLPADVFAGRGGGMSRGGGGGMSRGGGGGMSRGGQVAVVA